LIAKGSPQILSGNFFLKNYRLKIVKQQKRKKIKGNKLEISILKVFGYFDALHVSTFVCGIKKKTLSQFGI
jgi:hypothetical protein